MQSYFNINQYSFKQLLFERMIQVDEWLIFKIQKQKKPHKFERRLTDLMYESFMVSFSSDHNMIVEEFEFYQQLSPKMQSEVVEFLFSDTIQKFWSSFAFFEKGFRNECII